jgi:hypothetical protein
MTQEKFNKEISEEKYPIHSQQYNKIGIDSKTNHNIEWKDLL